MPKDRTLRTILTLARANGLPSEMAAALSGTIAQYSESAAEEDAAAAAATAAAAEAAH
jgi:hypothetical protein